MIKLLTARNEKQYMLRREIMNKSLFKKFGATFVALTLAFSSTSAVSAAGDTSEFQPKVTYSKGNYTFAKLSHPDKAVSTPDGIVDYLGGGNCCSSL